MSIVAADLKLYTSSGTPANDTDPSGGAITATEVLGTSLGELVPLAVYNASGGADIDWYYKVFCKNTHASIDLTDAVIYVENGLIAVASNGVVTAVSTSASDNTTKKLKVYGYDASSAAVTEEIVLNGTTTVTGSQVFSSIRKIELLTSGGALTTAAGDITITRGVVLGKIPLGFDTATNEYYLWLEAALDGSGNVANRLTAPGGASWSIPNTYATGLAVANGQVLTHGSAQGIWIRPKMKAGTLPTAQMRIIIRPEGNTT